MENDGKTFSNSPSKSVKRSTKKFTQNYVQNEQQKLNNFDKFNCSRLNYDIVDFNKNLAKEKYKEQNNNLQNYLKNKIIEYGSNQDKDESHSLSHINRRKTTSHIVAKSKFSDDYNEKFNLKDSDKIKRNSYKSNNIFSFLHDKNDENLNYENANNNIHTNRIDNSLGISANNNLHSPTELLYASLNKNHLDKSNDSFYSKRTDLDNSKREIVSKLAKTDIKEEKETYKDIHSTPEIVNNEILNNKKYKIDFKQFEKIDQNNSNFIERPLFKFKNLKESQTNSEDDKNYKDEAYIQTTILIYPESDFKKTWDYFIIFFIVYSITVSPTRIAFNYQDELWSFYFIVDFILDIAFLFDIIVNFLVPFYDSDENLVLSVKHIAVSYIMSWFFMDLLSSLPISFFQIFFQTQTDISNKNNHNSKFDKYLRLLRILKWFRIIRIIKVAKHYNNQTRPNSDNFISKFVYDQGVYSRLIKSGLIFFLLVHLSSCLWIFIGQSSDSTNSSWLKLSDLEQVEDFEVYIASLYFSLTTIYSIGYGDIVSTNILERVYNCIFMMIGVMVFSFAISSLSTMFLSTDKVTKKYEDSLNILDEMRYEYNINNEFYEKIKNSLRYQYIKNYSDRYALLSSLPRNLKNEIIIILHKKQIKDLNFFSQKPYDFILYLLPLLISIKMVKGEFIFCIGEFVEEMYLCVNGCLSLHLGYLFHNIEVAQIRTNNNFGDILMYSNEQSPFDFKVKSRQCELLVLKKIEYSKLKMKFPDIVINELKKSLEEYKFIMERRRVFIETIVNTNTNDLDVIMKAVKKIRYQTYDKATLNMLSVTHKKKKNAEYLKKLVMKDQNNDESNIPITFSMKYKDEENEEKFKNIEIGLEEEMKINESIYQENNLNYFNCGYSNELKNRNSSFNNLNSSSAKNKSFSVNQLRYSLNNTKLSENKKKPTLTLNERLGNKVKNKEIKNKFIDSENNKNQPKIKFNYYHIKNNIDKYFYSNGQGRSEKDLNPPHESRQFIDQLNKKTTFRLRTLIDKKSSQFKKVRTIKTMNIGPNRRVSSGMKKIRYAFNTKKSSSSTIDKEFIKSKPQSKNNLSKRSSKLPNEKNLNINTRKTNIVATFPTNNSNPSKKEKDFEQNYCNNEIKNISDDQEIRSKNEISFENNQNQLKEEVIYKKLNNKMDAFLKLINSEECSDLPQSSSSD